jgi:hypothetical protein
VADDYRGGRHEKERGSWVAIRCACDQSPPLVGWRLLSGRDEADVYYYRATSWAKLYRRSGCLSGVWPALAATIRWPLAWEELRDGWRRCGIVSGEADELYCWRATNGWLEERAERDRIRHANKAKAGRASARARRLKKRKQGR